MNHYSTSAFYECMYLHYAERLTDKSLPYQVKQFLEAKQQEAAARYAESFLPAHQRSTVIRSQIISIITNEMKMQNPQTALQLQTDQILQMAAIIEKRIHDNQPCFIYSNPERIALKDQNNQVIAWVKNS